ncbi:Mitochondrial MYO2 receptor-related protein 1 [Nakaseomyces bracarensis]|uniref:Mitochondrial MYO2 receptor-related protein 1 n=1 Tax=Nakaseomyces bracarensis TaxID=273131 RepID=A0ABR4NN63_9SACH
MNSPTFKSELSPTMSPIAFGLDDKSLLSSPTKLKLDSGGHNAGSMNSLLYPTSLSKLSELSRTGRSQQRMRRDSDTLRSVSPIRLQFQNTGNGSQGCNFANMNAPKMLKPEYLKKHSTTSLPLLSALMMKGNHTKANNNGAPSVNSSTTAANFDDVTKIKETLDLLRQEVVPKTRNKAKTPEISESQLNPTEPQGARNVSEANSEETVFDNPNESHTKTDIDNVDEQQYLRERASHQTLTPRILSNETNVSVESEEPEVTNGINVDMLPTDRNGFVQIENKNVNTNRYSFISATSTDYDLEWYENPNMLTKNTNPRPGPMNRVSSVIREDITNQNVEHQASNSSTSLEATKLDLKIKQLELEISELKLQNEKLVHSINTNRIIEDRLLIDLIGGSHESHNSLKPTQSKDMEKKVKQLEKKFDSYKKVLKRLKVINDSPPLLKGKHKHNNKKTNEHHKKNDNIQLTDNRGRILRISSTELRKIDEQQDSSASPSSFSEFESSESFLGDDEIDEIDLEEAIPDDKIVVKKRQDATSSTASTTSSKKGFHLNFQVQVDEPEKQEP